MSAADCTIDFDRQQLTGKSDMPLIEFLARQEIELPHVCYHGALGAIETCDVCWVVLDGELVRGCTIRTKGSMAISSNTERSRAAI